MGRLIARTLFFLFCAFAYGLALFGVVFPEPMANFCYNLGADNAAIMYYEKSDTLYKADNRLRHFYITSLLENNQKEKADRELVKWLNKRPIDVGNPIDCILAYSYVGETKGEVQEAISAVKDAFILYFDEYKSLVVNDDFIELMQKFLEFYDII